MHEELSYSFSKQEASINIDGIKDVLFAFENIEVKTINAWSKSKLKEDAEKYKVIHIQSTQKDQCFQSISFFWEDINRQEQIWLTVLWERISDELHFIYNSVKMNLNVRYFIVYIFNIYNSLLESFNFKKY